MARIRKEFTADNYMLVSVNMATTVQLLNRYYSRLKVNNDRDKVLIKYNKKNSDGVIVQDPIVNSYAYSLMYCFIEYYTSIDFIIPYALYSLYEVDYTCCEDRKGLGEFSGILCKKGVINEKARAFITNLNRIRNSIVHNKEDGYRSEYPDTIKSIHNKYENIIRFLDENIDNFGAIYIKLNNSISAQMYVDSTINPTMQRKVSKGKSKDMVFF